LNALARARLIRALGIFLDMRIFKPLVSTEWMIKWSPAFLLASITLLSVSLIFGRFSLLLFLSSIIFGLIYTVLTLLYWKWESNPLSLIVAVIDIVVMVWGMSFTMEWAFPEARSIDSGWAPFAQYISMILTIFFAILFLFRSWLRKQLVTLE
jgi:hypothetical protein